VAAVTSAYNRRELTLACLRSLEDQKVPGVQLDAYVLDDASTDGTAAAIGDQFPEVTLLHGDGNQFWNGGMRAAFGAAMERDYDFYLWMNDDTELDDGALAKLLDTHAELTRRGVGPVIVAGSTREPGTKELTYGGLVRHSRLRPLHWSLVEPGPEPQPVETMNGNTVLIPREVARRVGNIDAAYIQQMGDYDYGMRARQAGCQVWITAGWIGECADHPLRRTDEQPLGEELSRLWSTKELQPKAWLEFSRRYAGPLWPVYFASPYVKRGWALVLERTPLRRLLPGS
jgi:GT2 family glycosyltransferase